MTSDIQKYRQIVEAAFSSKNPLKEMDNDMYETTPKGTRYKFVDSPRGSVLLVNGHPHKVHEATDEAQVAGMYYGGGPNDDGEVWNYDENDEPVILFQGPNDKCWDFIIDQLGDPHSDWEGFAGDYYQDDYEFADDGDDEDDEEDDDDEWQ